MPTNRFKERKEQKKWKLRPQFRKADWFDRLLDNEFLTPEVQEDEQSRVLGQIIEFAVAEVPYYRDLFASEGLKPKDIESPRDLPRIPILTRKDVREQMRRLLPSKLPRGESIGRPTESSGSTGNPLQVVHSTRSRRMFALLKQRECRWFGFNPKGVMGWIRTPETLARRPQDDPPGPGETARLETWPAVGRYFKTGPYVGFSAVNRLWKQADWVARLGPNYLLCGSPALEHLALTFQDRKRPANLKGYLAISDVLTPGMRKRIEDTFGAPVSRNYGVNEIGIVAARCPEGGRYHIHTEHCLVEVVDDDGVQCAPGEIGHVLVTTVTNYAMPLIRYDTGDMALTAEGPCPCGRTLPSFERIVGRHKHMSVLPAGTLELADQLRAGIEQMPFELAGQMRQYQLHHDRAENFELRVVCETAPPSKFFKRCKDIWRAAEGAAGHDLRIAVVDEIPRAPSGKFVKFNSEFYYPDRAAID